MWRHARGNVGRHRLAGLAAIIAVVVPWMTFRLALRQDRNRWPREQRHPYYNSESSKPSSSASTKPAATPPSPPGFSPGLRGMPAYLLTIVFDRIVQRYSTRTRRGRLVGRTHHEPI